MDSVNLPFRYEDKKIVIELLENVNAVLKDSDALEEKEFVKNMLKKASQAVTFVIIGNAGVGKSRFLKEFFQDRVYGQQETGPTVGIHEFRFGEQELVVRVDKNVTRHFTREEGLQGLCVVDMQGLKHLKAAGAEEAVKEYIYQSDVLFVAFQAGSVNDYEVWDLLEETDARKIVFVLTKCDLAEPGEIENNVMKISQYMSEAGIHSPVFQVSAAWEAQGEAGKSGMGALRDYVSRNIIGENPALTKQWSNIADLKSMLGELSVSFAHRKGQYEADAAVLKNIDTLMDAFRLDSRVQVKELKETLAMEIGQEIDRFQNEIIIKLNPRQIKERFPKGSTDFIEYMEFVNDAYRKRMADNVSKKTGRAIRTYLGKLESVFDEATGYFRERQSLLDLEDKFYGAMSQTKGDMVEKTSHNLEIVGEYCRTLNETSEDLFAKISTERSDYERKVHNSGIRGGIFGSAGVLGGFGLLGAGKALTATATAKTVFAAALSTATAWYAIMPAIVGGVVISGMAKKISSAKNMKDMEAKAGECIVEFKKEVAGTRERMVSEVLEAVDGIFDNELDAVDKSFSGFRKLVNTDSRDIPLLEQKINSVNKLMDKIVQMQEEK